MIRISEFTLATLDAVIGLTRNDHWMQALVVLYSAIDTLAWSTKDTGDVTRADFFRWVDAYMDPVTRLGCTPEDLYAARCAVVHSGASESRMIRQGEAAELWYVTAPGRKPELEAFIAQKGLTAKVVYTADLFSAFGDGALKFARELDADPDLAKRVAARMGRWLGFVPAGPLVSSE